MTGNRPSFLRRLIANSRLTNMDDLEDRIAAMPGTHRWTDESPVRFEIMKEKVKRGGGGHEGRMLPIMLPAMMGVRTFTPPAETIPHVSRPARNVLGRSIAFLLKCRCGAVSWVVLGLPPKHDRPE